MTTTIPLVERRLATVRRIEAAMAGDSWAGAIESIQASDRYRGLRIVPQWGLVPLGPDRESGLWEFVDLVNGEAPERGADGKLEIGEETGVVFVLLPAGTFWMGAATSGGRNEDPRAEANEGPVHQVTLSAFLLSKYEMTQGQWSRATGVNPSYSKGASTPVENVSWDDCVSCLEGLGMGLPTEAQWEYGARGGTETPWWTGSSETLKEAENLASWGTVPVGWLRANAFGLHDTAGNVREWCLDSHATYSLPVRKGDGLREAASGWASAFRVYRGGSWGDPASYGRSASRYALAPGYRGSLLGLRPARVITE